MTPQEQKSRDLAIAEFLAKKGVTVCPKAPEPKKTQRLSVFEENRIADRRYEKALKEGRVAE